MSDNRGRIHYGRFTTELRKALVLLCCPVIGFAQLAGPVERLSAAKTVFVDSFGTSDGAAMIQNKVLNRLLKSGRFEVVNSAEAADAVLAGVAERTKGERYPEHLLIPTHQPNCRTRRESRTSAATIGPDGIEACAASIVNVEIPAPKSGCVSRAVCRYPRDGVKAVRQLSGVDVVIPNRAVAVLKAGE